MPDMKRNVKDSVFTFLFRQPEYTRQLYLTLHPEDASVTVDDIKNVTLENILSNGQYNDLGVLAGGKLLLLVEAQSTFTVNVTLRLLMYLAQSYKESESYTDIRKKPLTRPCGSAAKKVS